MLNELYRGRVGYQGKDSMRDKAKRAFGSSMGMDMNMPRSRSEPSKIKPRMYARGGEVADYHEPESPKMKRGGHHSLRTPPLNIESARQAEHMRHGGHTKRHHAKRHHYEDGGMVGMLGSNPDTYSPVTAKRGGKICKAKAQHAHHRKSRRYDEGGPVQDESNLPPRPPAQNPDYIPAQRAMGFNPRQGGPGSFFERPMVKEALNFARQNGPRAMQMAQQYAPKAQEMINRYAPRLGQGLQRAQGFLKRNAGGAQEMIGQFSPDLAKRFGGLRSMVGLKRGGKAHHKNHHEHHETHHNKHHRHHSEHDEHYAMGGVGKIRHGQSTKSGMPIRRKVVKGR